MDSTKPINTEIFKLRYQVFHDELGVIKSNPEQQLYDHFDFLPETMIFTTSENDKLVGTVRLVIYSEQHKLPLFSIPSFASAIKQFDFKNRKFAEAGRLVVLKEYRKNFPTKLLQQIPTYCITNKVTDMLMVANPKIEPLFLGLGFQTIQWGLDTTTGIESPLMYLTSSPYLFKK